MMNDCLPHVKKQEEGVEFELKQRQSGQARKEGISPYFQELHYQELLLQHIWSIKALERKTQNTNIDSCSE